MFFGAFFFQFDFPTRILPFPQAQYCTLRGKCWNATGLADYFLRILQLQRSWKSSWTSALLKCVSSWLNTPGNRPFLYFLHTLLRTSTPMDFTKMTKKDSLEWKHTMSQLRAGEGVRWTFWYNTAASPCTQSRTTLLVMVVGALLMMAVDSEGWILLSNGYWAAVWLEMMFRHYWLAWHRSRRFSLGCQSPQLSSPLEFIWCLLFFFLGVLGFFYPTLVRNSVAKCISKQENSTTPCYSKKWWCLSFLFFHCKALTIFH